MGSKTSGAELGAAGAATPSRALGQRMILRRAGRQPDGEGISLTRRWTGAGLISPAMSPEGADLDTVWPSGARNGWGGRQAARFFRKESVPTVMGISPTVPGRGGNEAHSRDAGDGAPVSGRL